SDTIYIVSEVMKLKERSNTPHITFAQSWGPNFYSRGVYNWLIGKAYLNKVPSNRWCPASKNYFTVENNDVYACPNACILPELKIGVWDNENGLQITKDFWKDELSDKLTGMCSPDNCEYSRICQGGCRAFAFAYTKNFYGSPPFCLTKIIEQLI
ncbi:MAG: SPASM domain-containing protein, partial [Promethearchaeota archaeon]